MSVFLISSQCSQDIERLIGASVKYDASSYKMSDAGNSDLQMIDGDAVIDVVGLLGPSRNSFLDFLGMKQTAYPDIEIQIDAAIAAGSNKIIFNFDSPGGNINGMYSVMQKIKDSGIPTVARVLGQAQSAAYMLASQCNVIEARDPLCMIGSVGVVATISSRDGVVEITNSESPEKRPDVSTDAGIASYKKTLDDIYDVVITMVAEGRRTTVGAVNRDFGRGASMTAKSALAKKMIDAIGFEKPKETKKTAGETAKKTGSFDMNIEQLKAEHPAVYAAIFESGKTAGAEDAAKMAKAHMNLAEASGDTKRALADIANGVDARDPEVTTHHQMKAIKLAQVEARTDEAAPELGEGDDPKAQAVAAKDDDDLELIEACKEIGGRYV